MLIFISLETTLRHSWNTLEILRLFPLSKTAGVLNTRQPLLALHSALGRGFKLKKWQIQKWGLKRIYQVLRNRPKSPKICRFGLATQILTHFGWYLETWSMFSNPIFVLKLWAQAYKQSKTFFSFKGGHRYSKDNSPQNFLGNVYSILIHIGT